MSDELRVSVVIPAYNAERFLAETLNAILAQTVSVAEVVVVDDGSTDGTAALASGFGAPVRVVSKENGGVSSARNRGVSEASNEWIGFCDADDVWLPEKLERQLRWLERDSDAVAALTGAARIGPDGEPVEFGGGMEGAAPRDVTLCGLLHRRISLVPVSIPSTLLASRELLERVGPWDETLSDAADWDYLIRIRALGPLTGPEDALVLYRVHDGAMSADVEARIIDEHRLFRKLEANPEIRSRCGDELPAARAWNATVQAASLFRAGRLLGAAGIVLGSLVRSPGRTVGALLERAGGRKHGGRKSG